MLIDSHAHLEMSDYDADRDAVIKRALDQGIEIIITIGIGRKECEQALELARGYPFIYAALGLHPHNAKKDAARLYDFIKESVSNKKVVALGEMGLDFFKNWSPQQDQVRCFHEQLAMARELKLPVITVELAGKVRNSPCGVKTDISSRKKKPFTSSRKEIASESGLSIISLIRSSQLSSWLLTCIDRKSTRLNSSH